MIRCFAIAAFALATLAFSAPVAAQSGGDTYTARLGWVPTTPADRPNVVGKGSATGTLAGRKLTIAGTFEGLVAPATVARLHQGITKGSPARRSPTSRSPRRRAGNCRGLFT